MTPAEALRRHAQLMEDLRRECQDLPVAAAVTRRGLVRKLGFEAAVHASLAAETGDSAHAWRWEAIAHALERSWAGETPTEAALLLLDGMLAGAGAPPPEAGPRSAAPGIPVLLAAAG